MFGDVGETCLLQGLVIYQVLDFWSRAVHIGVLEYSRGIRTWMMCLGVWLDLVQAKWFPFT